MKTPSVIPAGASVSVSVPARGLSLADTDALRKALGLGEEADGAEIVARAEAVMFGSELGADALRSAREALGNDDAPFICNAISAIKAQRDDARLELAQRKLLEERGRADGVAPVADARHRPGTRGVRAAGALGVALRCVALAVGGAP